jgi:arylsulfatase A-like enzyme
VPEDPVRRPAQPNIVLIHWHDLGTHLGAYGHGDVHSPNLDRLAAESVLFTRAFATAPQCTPARGSLFTGRYPHSNGLMGLAHRGWEYADGEKPLPMLLRNAGYRSTLIGLQHESQCPRERLGYDEIVSGGDREEYCGPVSQAAVRWLQDHRQSNDPFLLVAGFFEVHRPYPPGRYDEPDGAGIAVPAYLPDAPAVRQDLAGFYGAIRAADAATGAILQAIDENGLRDNTLVIFTTDHGAALPRAKGTLYDPGLQVALMMRAPGPWGVSPVAHHGMVSHVDVLPTLLELVGVDIPPHVQGKSFAGLLRPGMSSLNRTEIFAEKTYHSEYDPMRAVRTERFKYIRNYELGPALQLPIDIESSLSRTAIGDAHMTQRAAYELYDLSNDPLEHVNLADEPAWRELRHRLAAMLEAWQRETGDPILHGPIPPPGRIEGSK